MWWAEEARERREVMRLRNLGGGLVSVVCMWLSLLKKAAGLRKGGGAWI